MTAPTPTVETGAEQTGAGQLARFREARRRYVSSAQGPLALVNTEWITGDPSVGQTAFGVPGTWFPLAHGQSGLRLEAAASDNIEVDGQVVDGGVVVHGADDPRASTLRFSDTVTGTVIASEDGDYALRVWDARSDAARDFGSIDAFAYDPSWVVEAQFAPIEGGSTIGIAHLKDGGATRERVVPAKITFARDGVDVSLAAFIDDGGLLLVFSDATSGDSTYGVGRFLRVTAPALNEHPDARQSRTVTLDFNRAYLPPCAFSYHFNCPMPPAQNRLTFAVEAGEKNVLAHDGRLLH